MYRLITQADVDKHPEWASQGKSVNQMHDFPEDEQGNEIDDDAVKGKEAKPEKPADAGRPMRDEAKAPEKPAAKAEKPVTANDRKESKKEEVTRGARDESNLKKGTDPRTKGK